MKKSSIKIWHSDYARAAARIRKTWNPGNDVRKNLIVFAAANAVAEYKAMERQINLTFPQDPEEWQATLEKLSATTRAALSDLGIRLDPATPGQFDTELMRLCDWPEVEPCHPR